MLSLIWGAMLLITWLESIGLREVGLLRICSWLILGSGGSLFEGRGVEVFGVLSCFSGGSGLVVIGLVFFLFGLLEGCILELTWCWVGACFVGRAGLWWVIFFCERSKSCWVVCCNVPRVEMYYDWFCFSGLSILALTFIYPSRTIFCWGIHWTCFF